MPQAPKPLCLNSVLKLGDFPFLISSLGSNKNWPPNTKVKKIEIFQNKMGLKGCIWSSFNAIGTQTPCLIHFRNWDNSIFSLLALWGNKNCPSSRYKDETNWNFQNKMGLKGWKWSSSNTLNKTNLSLLFIFREFYGTHRERFFHAHYWSGLACVKLPQSVLICSTPVRWSIHEDFELHPTNPRVMGVVSNIPGPYLAMHRDHDSGGQVIELNKYVWTGKGTKLAFSLRKREKYP